jgi:hypothetical protein
MRSNNKPFKTSSRTSPKTSHRGCLCQDNTYSSKCCDGSLQAQGIGNITGSISLLITEDEQRLITQGDLIPINYLRV